MGIHSLKSPFNISSPSSNALVESGTTRGPLLSAMSIASRKSCAASSLSMTSSLKKDSVAISLRVYSTCGLYKSCSGVGVKSPNHRSGGAEAAREFRNREMSDMHFSRILSTGTALKRLGTLRLIEIHRVAWSCHGLPGLPGRGGPFARMPRGAVGRTCGVASTVALAMLLY